MKAPAVGLAAIAALALAGCNTSYNYFQDEPAPKAANSGPSTLFGALLMRSGIGQPERPMDTTPRPPIAIPPTTDLPPPGSGDVTAQAGAAWPKDASLTQSQKQRAAAKAEDKAAAYERDPRQSVSPKLSPQDMKAGQLADGDPPAKGNSKSWLDPTRKQSFHLMPWELAKTFMTPTKDNVLTPNGQAAPRQYLIEPPDDYRQPASTAALPKTKDIKESDWAKEQLYKRQDNKNPALMTPGQQ